MLIPVLLFIVGLLLLIKGGDWFVDGACGIAHRFSIPEILIGATIVSIGTTLPEVMVSASAALGGHSEISYGNAIGSVICNTSLISAITIACRPGTVEKKSLRVPVAFFFAAAVIYAAVAYISGQFTRPFGIFLLAVFAVYILLNVHSARKPAPAAESSDSADGTSGINDEDGEEDIPAGTGVLWKDLLLLVIGAALIAVGADLLVDNGTLIAQYMGVPESVIALTFVALGTSLPELVTAITSLIKGHSSLSLGNIIGANLFNIVLVSGTAMTLRPFSIPCSSTLFGMNSSLVLDIPLMLVVMLILTVPALLKGKMYRIQGIALLVIYACFCAIQFTF